MVTRIKRISPWQTAKTMAVVYFIVGVVIAICGIFFSSFIPTLPGQPRGGMGVLIALPFLYALAGLIFVPIGCALYNLAAGWAGGIEVTLEDQSGRAS